jgi:hypothetical protein
MEKSTQQTWIKCKIHHIYNMIKECSASFPSTSEGRMKLNNVSVTEVNILQL